MYYTIQEGNFCQTDMEKFLEQDDSFCVLDASTWNNEHKLKELLGLGQQDMNIHFCKIENYQDYLFGTMKIPSKEQNGSSGKFAFYILRERVVFIEKDGFISNHIAQMNGKKRRVDYSLERFIYDLFVSFLEGDVLFLQKIQRKIQSVEAAILEDKDQDFGKEMLTIKKQIMRFNRYYGLATDMIDELIDSELDFFERGDKPMFDRLRDRFARLEEECIGLREYAIEVQNIYQAQIGIQQNNVMKMLTVVTTVFMPLTLIAGWYGMNFINMPELKSSLGYPVVILVSIVIIIVCIIIFRRKKFW